jgi:FKBP-type peptidyl-prolyl cis-trans isomerase SlpA
LATIDGKGIVVSETIKPDSLVTLHYRLATADDIEIVSTFGHTPATLQLGSGELAPPLEACLAGMATGERKTFTLGPEQAFGPHNPQLLQRLPLKELPPSSKIEPQALVEFAAPGGGKFTGMIREVTADAALIDFNHPLAGKTIRFEVEIVGTL